MIINPKIAIEKGWVKNVKTPAKQVQPNAIDFTLDKVFLVEQKDLAIISESTKTMRHLTEVAPVASGWQFEGQQVYDGTSDVYVEVPEGMVALLYTRSTFVRNGIFLVSGLYDSGYKGQIGFTFYTLGGSAWIEKGTRFGQIMFVPADSAGVYAGQWNHEQGTHYREPQQPTSVARELERASTISTDDVGKPAGTKSFI